MNLIANPVANLTAAHHTSESVRSLPGMRLCILGHPRHNRVSGHMPQFLTSIIEEAAKRGWWIDLCISPELCEFVRNNNGSQVVNVRFFAHGATPKSFPNTQLSRVFVLMWGWIATVRAYCTVPAIRNCDHLLIIDGDFNHTAFAIGLFVLPLFQFRVSTIVFGTIYRVDKKKTRLREPLGAKVRFGIVRRFLGHKKFNGIITTNPSFESVNRDLPKELLEKVRYVNEIEPQWTHPMVLDQARGMLGIDEQRQVVLCYGYLSPEHKGLPQLLAAVDHPEMGDVLILLVGTPNADTEELLNSDTGKRLRANGQIHEIFGYVSSECERTAFSASDAVWIATQNLTIPSGVLEIARMAGVPIVATIGSVIGSTVEQHGLGSLVDATDSEQARRGLRECFLRARSRETLNVADVALSETDTNHRGFGKRICDAIVALENAPAD